MPTKAYYRLDPEKKKSIIEAAFKEFENNTVDTASINSIAKRAGISRTTLYYYFHDISDIFSLIVDLLMDEFKQKMIVKDNQQIDIFESFFNFFEFASSFKGTEYENFISRIFKEMSTETRRMITDPFFKYYTKNVAYVKNLEKIKYSSPRELYDILFMLFSIVNSALQYYYTTDVAFEKVARRVKNGFRVVMFGAIKEEYRNEEFKNE